MPSSPAAVVATYLKVRGVGVFSPTVGAWRVYYHREPEGTTVQDQVVTVYDEGNNAEGGSVGRRGRRQVVHPVIHIRIRTGPSDYVSGWNKGQEILNYLAEIHNQVVTGVPDDPGAVWIVQGFTPEPAELVHVMEEEKSKRQIFGINGQITIKLQ